MRMECRMTGNHTESRMRCPESAAGRPAARPGEVLSHFRSFVRRRARRVGRGLGRRARASNPESLESWMYPGRMSLERVRLLIERFRAGLQSARDGSGNVLWRHDPALGL